MRGRAFSARRCATAVNRPAPSRSSRGRGRDIPQLPSDSRGKIQCTVRWWETARRRTPTHPADDHAVTDAAHHRRHQQRKRGRGEEIAGRPADHRPRRPESAARRGQWSKTSADADAKTKKSYHSTIEPMEQETSSARRSSCVTPSFIHSTKTNRSCYFAISTSATMFNPLSAMTRLPSRVAIMLRTTPPPPGITQL
jgi:hypothetical protein